MKKALLGLVAFGFVAQSQALIWGFSAPVIHGGQEVPPTTSSAFGTGSFTVDDVTGTLRGTVYTTGFALPTGGHRITGAHIHRAPMGVNGPVIFDLLANAVVSPIVSGDDVILVYRGTIALSELPGMIAGNTYFNVHSAAFPGGEIRGQIDCVGVVPEPATIAALGLGGVALIRRRRK